MNQVDTIVAAATPAGRGGVAIVRVSGPAVATIAQQIIKKKLRVREATFTDFYAIEGEILDQGIALYFAAPHSFTGEDVLELQGHGSPAVVAALIEAIMMAGARPARAGEFSERAFLNGKMDLVQAEAVADLIDAASRTAARYAMRSLQGVFSEKIHEVVNALIQLRTFIEAEIDFSDEEIDFLQGSHVITRVSELQQQLQTIIANAQQGHLLREGITVVLTGAPNVGKSSLLNRLSGRESAIVTDIPGTTRDVLREMINIKGMPVHVIDTAGLRESHDPIEQEGIRRAYQAIAHADVVLAMQLAGASNQAVHGDWPATATVIYVENKIDLLASVPHVKKNQDTIVIALSARTGEGIDLLKTEIARAVHLQPAGEGIFSARRRHLDALARAAEFLQAAAAQTRQLHALDLLAEELRLAQHALGEITGEVTSDDLLGEIFSSFCIGK